MIVNILSNTILWLNYFPPSKPGTVFSNTKVPVKLVLGTVMEYKKIFHLQPVKYVQLHPENEPQSKIDMDQTVK